jgi:hypothetical protein
MLMQFMASFGVVFIAGPVLGKVETGECFAAKQLSLSCAV